MKFIIILLYSFLTTWFFFCIIIFSYSWLLCTICKFFSLASWTNIYNNIHQSCSKYTLWQRLSSLLLLLQWLFFYILNNLYMYFFFGCYINALLCFCIVSLRIFVVITTYVYRFEKFLIKLNLTTIAILHFDSTISNRYRILFKYETFLLWSLIN